MIPRFTRILCAVDFAPASRETLKLAAELAQGGATLAICHVFEHDRVAADVGDVFGADQLVHDLRADAEHELEICRRIVADTVPAAEAHALAGVAWDEITRFAERFDADLVVVGTGTRRGSLLGSVAERVVRHAPSAVLVAAGEASPITRILCAVDFSPPAHEAMLAAADLAIARGAALTLVYSFASGTVGSQARRQSVEGRLGIWRAEVESRVGGPVASEIVDGRPDEGVLEAARAGGYDLVVAGTHGRSGIRRALLGSVAERIVRHADRAVLLVRAS